MIYASTCQVSQNGNQVWSSSSAVSSSNSNSGGPLRVKILVANGGITNLSSGNGRTSVSMNDNSVHVEADGKTIDVPDSRGPYVITNEPDGVLKRREMTPEDEREAQQMQQQLQQNMQNMQASMQQWQNNFQRQMQQFQQNMNQMSSNMGNMFGGNFPFGNTQPIYGV